MMLSSRYGPGLVLAGLLALALGCGGGGGGGGGGSSDEKKPPPTPPPALQVTGLLGGGRDGWHLDVDVGKGIDQRSFRDARDVFVTPDGTIYVADKSFGRVSKWSADGVSLGWIKRGLQGWQTGALPRAPDLDEKTVRSHCMAVDSDGNVYLGYEHTVIKRDPDGNAVGWIGGGRDGWQTGGVPYSGLDYRSFRWVRAVHVTADGTIYVADKGAHRVSKWSADGTAIGWVGGGSDGWKTEDAVEPERDTWGDFIGLDDLRSFKEARDVFVDDDGSVFVVDALHHRVTRWNAAGECTGALGGGDREGWLMDDVGGARPGDEDHELDWPGSICVNGDGDVFVTRKGNRYGSRISRWTKDGTVVGWIGLGEIGWQRGPVPSRSGRDERWFSASDIAVLDDGTILILEGGWHRLSRWDDDGNPTGWIGGGVNGWQTGDAPEASHDLAGFHGAGGLDVDGKGRIYVVDDDLERVTRWSPDGVAEASFGHGADGWQTGPWLPIPGTSNAASSPFGVCVDANGTIYVADYLNDCVRRWGADGTSQGWIGGGRDGWRTGPASPDDPTTGPRTFDKPGDVWVDDRGYLYVANRGGSGISRWDLDGVHRGNLGGEDNGWKASTNGYQYPKTASMYVFKGPAALTLASDGTMFVADREARRVCKWSPWAEALGWMGGGKDGLHTYPATYDMTPDKERTEGGRGTHRFAYPGGVALDGDGHLYVADSFNARICAWRVTGDSAVALGWIGHGNEVWQRGLAPELEPEAVPTPPDDLWSFKNPGGIYVTPDGTLYVADGYRTVRWSRVGAD